MHEIELKGLDGGNLLGYLAALGTLRVLTLGEPEVEIRMSWVEREWWTPVVHHSRVATGDELLEALAARVCGEETIDPAWTIGEDLTLGLEDFREHLKRAASSATTEQRAKADFLAAFGSDAFGAGSKKDQMVDTDFRTMSGAGHQHFLGFLKELARETSGEHLRRALLEPWDYADGRPSLRWDPADYRPHALRAVDPSGDPIRTMRGANRLALEALPLFPTVPGTRRVTTVAFTGRKEDLEVRWPVWTESLELNTVACLVASGEAATEGRPRGIAQVYAARRFTEGKYRNFSPARAMV